MSWYEFKSQKIIETAPANKTLVVTFGDILGELSEKCPNIVGGLILNHRF